MLKSLGKRYTNTDGSKIGLTREMMDDLREVLEELVDHPGDNRKINRYVFKLQEIEMLEQEIPVKPFKVGQIVLALFDPPKYVRIMKVMEGDFSKGYGYDIQDVKDGKSLGVGLQYGHEWFRELPVWHNKYNQFKNYS